MKKICIASALLSVLVLTPAVAQHHGHAHAHSHHGASHQSPYAGMQNRAIKALSDEQVAGLKAGKGMAMAMPAELNGYPGPLHTLQMESELQLTQVQKTRTEQLFADMQAQSQNVGEEVIAAERELDALFRDKKATAETVAAAVHQAAMAQGKLRETHLRYHLAMMDVLTPEQVAQYNQLRGY